MRSELIINCNPTEIRIARLENGTIAELFLERAREAGSVGNVYKGRITHVLPGMQAAFVDIGLERTAFLYVTEIAPELLDLDAMMGSDEGSTTAQRSGRRRSRDIPRIQDLVKEGQDVIVQITRDPIGTKGARLTSHISLPGRFLVLMPTVDHVGISRRIEDEKERLRLKNFIYKTKPKGMGFIVRTMSDGVSQKELKQDMEMLLKIWSDVESKQARVKSPAIIHEELGIILRTVRDLFTLDIDRVVIDSENEWKKVRQFAETYIPRMKNAVELYKETEPIFDAFGIEVEISRALGKKVWLKSGGYIIIEQTEALITVDVNTGKFIGKRNLEDTILKTNLEAAKEIAYQLRLRDLGGILIIDFIDMKRFANRDKVFHAFKEHLRFDRARTTMTKITDLGLIEMTRKKTHESLAMTLCEPCFYCEGRGYLKSKATISHEIFRELYRNLTDYFSDHLTIHVHSTIADLILEEERVNMEEFERKTGKKLAIKPREDFHMEQFEIAEQGAEPPLDIRE
ncbi:MAG: ribonuclease G [Deltaproteobacteria bacterium RIFCSPHIGHO2_02_FULL_50_15]|nr:MAG: ribonuclease G [Deltaproteobacteria bacterium RIFCSPHIGHO2_02_FULL_50_15]